MEIKTNDIDILKAEVEYTLGRKIMTSKDCIDLSEVIFIKTGFRINSNTLRRFFGLVKTLYPASISTLNILSVYTGASSFEDLCNYRRMSNEKVEKETPKLLKYLTTIFQNTQVDNIYDDTFREITQITIKFLNQDKDLAYQFQRAIAKTVNGKQFYFEQFVNIDKLDAFYGKGLRYYISENKTIESQLFGHSLLCFRYWLTDDMESLKSQYKNLIFHDIPEKTDPLICARFFSAKIFFAHANNLDTSKIIGEANEYYSNVKSISEFKNSFPGFELIFSEALLLTGHFNEAYKYITEGIKNNFDDEQLLKNKDLYKSFDLYHAIVMFNIGNEKRATELFDQINPFGFYFITKQFNTILYLLLGQKLNRIRSVKNQIDSLLQQTGFKRMKLSTAVLNKV